MSTNPRAGFFLSSNQSSSRVYTPCHMRGARVSGACRRTAYQGGVTSIMEEQNKQQNEPICSLYSLLESGNLLDYYERFLQQGGDDINQLCDATEDEFKEITTLVGMQTKPLHIRRLQKALIEWKNKNKTGRKSAPRSTLGPSWMDRWNTKQSSRSSGITVTKPTTTTLTITAETAITEPTPSVSKRGRPPNSSKTAKSKSLSKGGVFELKLPSMEAIIDWESLDEDRKELIRQHSRIYGRDTKKRKTNALNGHEQMINEAAAQLCLRDPTLLVRRDELFTQARRIVRDSGFSFVHGHSRSKYVEETAAETPEDPVPGATSSASKIKRQERLHQVDEMLERSKQQQDVLAQKKKELEHANQPTSDIRLEIRNLERQLLILQAEQKELRKKQRRSERYYNTKGTKRRLSATMSVEENDQPEQSEANFEEGLSSEGVPEQHSPAVVTEILQQPTDVSRARVDQPAEDDSCVRTLFTLIPQQLAESGQADAAVNQALRASLLAGAQLDSPVSAFLRLSNEEKTANIQALQNVLSQIGLPAHVVNTVSPPTAQQLLAQVMPATTQDQSSLPSPMTQEFVSQSGMSLSSHLVGDASSAATSQLSTPVVTSPPQHHSPVASSISQGTSQIPQHQYVQPPEYS